MKRGERNLPTHRGLCSSGPGNQIAVSASISLGLLLSHCSPTAHASLIYKTSPTWYLGFCNPEFGRTGEDWSFITRLVWVFLPSATALIMSGRNNIPFIPSP